MIRLLLIAVIFASGCSHLLPPGCRKIRNAFGVPTGQAICSEADGYRYIDAPWYKLEHAQD